MFLVLNDRNKIIAISKAVTELEDGGIKLNNGLILCDDNLTITEVDSIPNEIKEEKYFYINNEFVLNPNWKEPYSEEDVDKLKQEVKELTEECGELNETILDLTDVIVENMNI